MNQKTNAMRQLDKAGIKYALHDFLPIKETEELGYDEIAGRIGRPKEKIFKTILCQGHSKTYYVLVLQGTESVDLKKAARLFGEKSLELADGKDLEKITGYVRGGCSPVGMKKQFKTVLDDNGLQYDSIIVSAGRRGIQMELAPDVLVRHINALVGDIRSQEAPIL